METNKQYLEKQLAIDELKKTDQLLADAVFEVVETKYGVKCFASIEKIQAKFKDKINNEIFKLTRS